MPAAVQAQMEFSLDEVDEEEAKPAKKSESQGDLIEELAAVQQIYALRLKRVELAPSVALSLNDPYLKHYGLGLALNYWFTNVLALGVNFNWYDWGTNPLERGTNIIPRIQNQFRLGVPINDWQMGLWVNFTYVPFYGKFKVRKKIFQWDSYLIGGVGIMRTQPIPVFDAAVRSFDWQTNVAFNVGIGLRIFLTRYLTFFTEFRAYMWPDQFENVDVAPDDADRNNPDTWLQSDSTFVANTSIQIGLTFFFPTRDYQLPK